MASQVDNPEDVFNTGPEETPEGFPENKPLIITYLDPQRVETFSRAAGRAIVDRSRARSTQTEAVQEGEEPSKKPAIAAPSVQDSGYRVTVGPRPPEVEGGEGKEPGTYEEHMDEARWTVQGKYQVPTEQSEGEEAPTTEVTNGDNFDASKLEFAKLPKDTETQDARPIEKVDLNHPNRPPIQTSEKVDLNHPDRPPVTPKDETPETPPKEEAKEEPKEEKPEAEEKPEKEDKKEEKEEKPEDEKADEKPEDEKPENKEEKPEEPKQAENSKPEVPATKEDAPQAAGKPTNPDLEVQTKAEGISDKATERPTKAADTPQSPETQEKRPAPQDDAEVMARQATIGLQEVGIQASAPTSDREIIQRVTGTPTAITSGTGTTSVQEISGAGAERMWQAMQDAAEKAGRIADQTYQKVEEVGGRIVEGAEITASAAGKAAVRAYDGVQRGIANTTQRLLIPANANVKVELVKVKEGYKDRFYVVTRGGATAPYDQPGVVENTLLKRGNQQSVSERAAEVAQRVQHRTSYQNNTGHLGLAALWQALKDLGIAASLAGPAHTQAKFDRQMGRRDD